MDSDVTTPVAPTLLEERVRELEAALAAARQDEDAVAQRVMEKLLASREAGTLKLPAADGVLMHAPVPPPPQGASPRLPESDDASQRRWILFQLLTEMRLLPQMYFDPRYRLSRTAQFAGPVLIIAVIASYFLVSAIPFIGAFLDRFVDIVLGIVFYVVMKRELIRYREVLDYLEKYGYR